MEEPHIYLQFASFFFYNLLSIYIFFFWDYYGFVLECVFVLEEKKALMLIGGFSILFHHSLLLNSILESHCQKKLINLCILLIEKQLPPLIARIVSCTVHVKKKKPTLLYLPLSHFSFFFFSLFFFGDR